MPTIVGAKFRYDLLPVHGFSFARRFWPGQESFWNHELRGQGKVFPFAL